MVSIRRPWLPPARFVWSQLTVNAGLRVDLSERQTLLLSIGRDLRNTLGPRDRLLSYLGLQTRY